MKKAVIVAVFIAFVISLPLLAATYLGYTDIGSAQTVPSTGYEIDAGPFVLSNSDTASRIEIYTAQGYGQCTLGIRQDSGGTPGTMVVQTTGGALGGGTNASWWGQDLTSPQSLSAATYWIAIQCNPVFTMYYDGHTGNGRYVLNNYSAGALPTSYPGGSGSYNADISARVTLTGGGGGGGPTTSSGISLGMKIGAK